MGVLSWLVVGLIAGWLAGMVMKGGGFGVLGDIVAGIVGGLVGGFIASSLFGITDAVNGINVTSILVAFLGAVLVIFLLRALSPRSRRAL